MFSYIVTKKKIWWGGGIAQARLRPWSHNYVLICKYTDQGKRVEYLDFETFLNYLFQVWSSWGELAVCNFALLSNDVVIFITFIFIFFIENTVSSSGFELHRKFKEIYPKY